MPSLFHQQNYLLLEHLACATYRCIRHILEVQQGHKDPTVLEGNEHRGSSFLRPLSVWVLHPNTQTERARLGWKPRAQEDAVGVGAGVGAGTGLLGTPHIPLGSGPFPALPTYHPPTWLQKEVSRSRSTWELSPILLSSV